jgi:hypothetical protein
MAEDSATAPRAWESKQALGRCYTEMRAAAILRSACRGIGKACLLLGPSVAAGQQPAEPVPRYFQDEAAWRFGLGTDAAISLTDREPGLENQANDGSSNLDRLWLRLYARLSYEQKAELVVDVFSSNADPPSLFGLYGKLAPKPWIGLRAGLIPLTVGGWQERAVPSRQPLVSQPLPTQYLFSLRNDSVPRDGDELLSQRGKGRTSAFSVGAPGTANAVAMFYEHCWPIGAEAFGSVGGLRYRFAVTEGTPGSSVATHKEQREHKAGNAVQARVTYRFGDALRLGASWARGAYLLTTALPQPEPGREASDYHQQLFGADLRLEIGRLLAHGEWALSRYGSPFVAERLDTHGYYGEAAVRLAQGLQLAARVSGLLFSEVTASSGRRATWDADARRFEAGATWRFYEEKVALKAAWQRTRVEVSPVRQDDIAVLQLSFAH